MERELGTSIKRSHGKIVLARDYAYDVHLKNSLHQLLSNDVIFEAEVMSILSLVTSCTGDARTCSA